ncbi:hypothetical protein THRCLA_05376 [Thraustotheca clavata]|uniref:Uncharacterized protein n=1 Tax=Thraustotheca clavata TaxID=74557 RepID=A0A1V9ZW82_9STRA|nr:hypothetical protein THRCLA_05376 [Thraustotheca clavata]
MQQDEYEQPKQTNALNVIKANENEEKNAAVMSFDRFYCDGSFLKLLHETLQKHAGKLNKGAVKLALNPHGIAYLFERLQAALSPRYAQDGSGRIDGWTIRQSVPNGMVAFDFLDSPMVSPLAQVPRQTAPQVGHLDVLKLSTLLHEAKYLKITNDAFTQIPLSPVLHLEIFSAMTSLELHQIPSKMLSHLLCFPRQLEILHYNKGTLTSPLDLLGNRSWPCLQTLKITHSGMSDWYQDMDTFTPALCVLDCSDNALKEVTALMAPTTLTTATFSHNKLQKFTLRDTYQTLTTLLLSHNPLKDLASLPIKSLPVLQVLDLSYNLFADLNAVSTLSALKLVELHLKGNPIARYPDFRRHVLFYLGDRVELDDTPWTGIELESMQYRRHQAADQHGYPILPPADPQLRPRHAVIDERIVLQPFRKHSASRQRVESAWSDNSVVSSAIDTEDFVIVSPSHRSRSASYYVDEFMRDLAEEEEGMDDEVILPSSPVTRMASGIAIQLFLTMEEADSLDLPISQEGIPAVIHVHSSKLVEMIDSGHVLTRPLASLRCFALTSTVQSMTLKLGFRHLPSVAYQIVNHTDLILIIQPLHDILCRKAVVGLKCLSCQSFILIRECTKRGIIQIRKCWICNSANVRECSKDQVPQRLNDMGVVLSTPAAMVQEERYEGAGFTLSPEYDEVIEDDMILVATDVSIKEIKLQWHQDEESNVAYYRTLAS